MPGKMDRIAGQQRNPEGYIKSAAGIGGFNKFLQEKQSGEQKISDTAMASVQYQDIFRLFPDLRQPRRIVPSWIRNVWQYQITPEGMEFLFTTWIESINREREAVKLPEFPLMEILKGESQVDTEAEAKLKALPKRGVAELAFIDLLYFALDIKRDGLRYPIEIVSVDRNSRIHIGERRWMSFHFLHWAAADDEKAKERWRLIPTVLATDPTSLQQASENGARSNLGVVEKARQFANLLIDMHGEENFISLEQALQEGSERLYYSQVADGETWRIPRGKGEILMTVLGLPDPVKLRELRSVLRLGDEMWYRADDEKWSYPTIKKYLTQSDDDTEDDDSEGDTVLKNTESLLKKFRKSFWELPDDEHRRKYIKHLRGLADELEGKRNS